METIIKLRLEELNESLLEKIKSFIGGKANVDVTISLKEFDRAYFDELEQSIGDAERGEHLVSFTMEEFMNYTPKKS